MTDNPYAVWSEYFDYKSVVKCDRIPQRLPDGSLNPVWQQRPSDKEQ